MIDFFAKPAVSFGKFAANRPEVRRECGYPVDEILVKDAHVASETLVLSPQLLFNVVDPFDEVFVKDAHMHSEALVSRARLLFNVVYPVDEILVKDVHVVPETLVPSARLLFNAAYPFDEILVQVAHLLAQLFPLHPQFSANVLLPGGQRIHPAFDCEKSLLRHESLPRPQTTTVASSRRLSREQVACPMNFRRDPRGCCWGIAESAMREEDPLQNLQ